MRRFALMLASLTAAAACAVEPGSTLHRYVAPSTEVVTNAWSAVSNRTAELIRSTFGSVDAYTKAETDERLAAKADEYAEWDGTPPLGETIGQPMFVVAPYGNRWEWSIKFTDEFSVAATDYDADENATALRFEYADPSGVGHEFTATRKRVLYTGDPGLAAPFDGWRTNTYSIAVGSNSVASADKGIALGFPNSSGDPTRATASASIAIGVSAQASSVSAVALGSNAKAYAGESVQIGPGRNNEAGTLKFRGYTLVDADGHIPVYRLPAGGADVQADMLDGVYYRRLIYDGSVYYVAVTNMPLLLQEQETDDPEETEP